MYDVYTLFASKCHSHTLSFSYLSMVHCQTREGALVMMYSGGFKEKKSGHIYRHGNGPIFCAKLLSETKIHGRHKMTFH